jgi:glycosyltransferase involved in cell wall biosynthesis
MRVLLLAEECNPAWPSLPLVGYNACRALSENVDAVVATHCRNREELERRPLAGARVEFIDNEFIARPMHALAKLLRGGTSNNWSINIAMSYFPYLAFERAVWTRFRDELHDGRFDVVHRVTPMSPALPSPLAKWSPVPFVLGPLNGGLKWPKGFRAELRREREWLTHLRGLARYMPYARATYHHAAAVLAAFPHTIQNLPPDVASRAIDFPEVGVDPTEFRARERDGTVDPLTFLYAGRLVACKCVDAAVEAFARSQRLRHHRLRIVGDGPERARLQQMVRDHELESCVEFLGWIPQEDVARAMRTAHVFVFPSIRELGAGVVVEAMASGLCCVVVGYGGPGSLIDESRGVRIPLTSKQDLIEALVDALEALAENPHRCRALGDEAQRIALGELSWSVKARKCVDVYEWVLGRRDRRPGFWRNASR